MIIDEFVAELTELLARHGARLEQPVEVNQTGPETDEAGVPGAVRPAQPCALRVTFEVAFVQKGLWRHESGDNRRLPAALKDENETRRSKR